MNVLWLAPHPIPTAGNMHPAPWITSLVSGLIGAGTHVTILTMHSNQTEEIMRY
jgi:hypothetical protein